MKNEPYSDAGKVQASKLIVHCSRKVSDVSLFNHARLCTDQHLGTESPTPDLLRTFAGLLGLGPC